MRESEQASARPLVVDIDGTLLQTDLLLESTLELLKRRPWLAVALPLWLLRGKANLKRQVAARTELDVSTLPLNRTLISWLKAERERGRAIHLASASDHSLVAPLVAHLPFISAGFASDGQVNNAAGNKRDRLIETFGEKGFDYVGNDWPDLPVWQAAGQAHAFNASPRLAKKLENSHPKVTVHNIKASSLPALLEAIRPRQWLKNLLVFVPLVTAHATDPLLWVAGVLAFISLCLSASGVYVLNDLLDLPHDREHPRKHLRPFASGRLSLLAGIFVSPLLMGAGLALAVLVGSGFLLLLLAYLLLTTLYSLVLKRLVLVDIFTLAGLYTLRIVAGGLAAGIVVSEWLLAFSIFTFLALAVVKRNAELQGAVADERETASGRGYRVGDLPMLRALGAGAAFSAVVILTLYLNSEAVVSLYSRPELLWGICALVLFWFCHMLMTTQRGDMHDDPVVFAVRDRVSLIVAVLAALMFLAAI